MYTVEHLTPQDFTWAIEVAGKNMISKEVGRPELYCREQFVELTNLMMRCKTVLIVKKDGRPAGVIGGFTSPNMFNPKFTTLVEILWYVVPEHRNTRAGLLLLKKFKEIGEEVADEVTLCTLSTSAVNHDSLARLGFQFKEKAFNYITNRG